ncbi:hypothetical protein [Thiolapillus sp.]|uniref:hypothetical protein n=1 Tax=Thiolapillus sp. TaxID=2017437 RepID=UPI003AF45C6E
MFSLWRKARRENSAASRLLGTTSLRFALHGWQRKKWKRPAWPVSAPARQPGVSVTSATARANPGPVNGG